MSFKSKKISLLLLAITALACSRAMFAFFNDPEGPNLLIVVGTGAIIYFLSLAVYVFDRSPADLKKLLLALAIQILVIAAACYYFSHGSTALQTTEPSAPTASATYSCDNGHTIHADYYQGAEAPQPAPGQPPVPTGTVKVALDGGEAMTLKQTISADGARYSDGNPQISQGQSGAESFVFWNKGNTALIMRNNQMDLTYTNCAQK